MPRLNPFRDPPPGFYPGAQRRRLVDQLRHLSQWSRRALLVLGAEGAGKSMLFRQLTSEIGEETSLVCLDGQRIAAEIDILVVLADTLGVSLPETLSSEVLTPVVADALAESSTGDHPLVVLVDDADKLEGAALHRLLSLCSEHRFRLLLFGHPSLPAMVRSVTQGLRFAPYEIELLAFSLADVRQYLEWCFEQAGNKGPIPFSEEQLTELHRRSNGLPGELNRLAGQQLDRRNDELSGLPAFRFPSTHLYLVAGLTAFLALCFLVIDQVDFNDDVVIENLPLTITEAAGAAKPSTSAAEEPTQALPQTMAEVVTGAVAETTAKAVTAAVEVEQLLQPVPAATPIPPPEPKLIDDVEVVEVAEANSVPAAGVVEVVPAATVEPDRTNASQPMTLAAMTDPILREIPGLRDGAWLLAQAEDDYTIQLVTLSSRDGLLRYLQRQREPNAFAVYARQIEEKLLYIVTYGQYSSKVAAQAATRELPAEVGKVQPWVRSFRAIHRAVTASG